MSIRLQVPPEPYPGLWNGDTYKGFVLSGQMAYALARALTATIDRVTPIQTRGAKAMGDAITRIAEDSGVEEDECSGMEEME